MLKIIILSIMFVILFYATATPPPPYKIFSFKPNKWKVISTIVVIIVVIYYNYYAHVMLSQLK